MTTIVTDGQTIAADGMRTWNGELRGLSFQKLTVRGNRIFAYCGSTPLMGPVIDWFEAGADPKAMPPHGDPDWTLLIIDSMGLRKASYVCAFPETFNYPFAIGAGGDYALGAVWAGATPRRAIELVSQHTSHTGGEIQVINIADVVGASLKEAAE